MFTNRWDYKEICLARVTVKAIWVLINGPPLRSPVVTQVIGFLSLTVNLFPVSFIQADRDVSIYCLDTWLGLHTLRHGDDHSQIEGRGRFTTSHYLECAPRIKEGGVIQDNRSYLAQPELCGPCWEN